MAKIRYQSIKFAASSLKIVEQANRILEEYARRGIVVTLRQLYYQFVSRDIIPNKQTEYKRLGGIVNDARLAGLIDWDHLQDRTRNLERLAHWTEPGGVIESAASSYHRDLWEGQDYYVEVWVEKDALLSVIEGPCNKWDVPFFACRGYTSQSEMWGAGQRLLKRMREGRQVRIIHLGDHDPSGVDMTRDISERLGMFAQHHLIIDYMKAHERRKKSGKQREETEEDYLDRIRNDYPGTPLEVNRVALNMNQIRQYNPPPNPAKLTDSRATAYIDEHGDESWELDALDPDVLIDLVETNIQDYLDLDQWHEMETQQEREREVLQEASSRWDEVAEFLSQ